MIALRIHTLLEQELNFKCKKEGNDIFKSTKSQEILSYPFLFLLLPYTIQLPTKYKHVERI